MNNLLDYLKQSFIQEETIPSLLSKLASPKEVDVKGHYRTEGGKTTFVDPHKRTVDEKDIDLEAEKEAKLREKQGKELALWKAWKEGGEKTSELMPLLKSFRSMIQTKANVYKGNVRIPPSSIDMEFQLRFVQGLKSYDPSKGSLGTYIYKYLDKGKRFIVEHQNIGRIPENRAYKIRDFNLVRGELSEQLGRPPTNDELSERLGWDLAEIDRMDSELRKDLVTQSFEEDPFVITASKSEEVLRLFKYELEGVDKEVYEYLTGFGKPRMISTKDIANKLGIPDYQVSRIKSSIEKKLRDYVVE